MRSDRPVRLAPSVLCQRESGVDFQKVISLGPSCETAWQIRQVVDQPEAYVFDWVIAPASSVAQAIRTDYAKIVEPDRLVFKSDAGLDHPYVLDTATNIEYHHDFRNEPDFMETYENVKGKYDYLIDRMRKTLDRSAVLFVHVADDRAEAETLRDAIVDRYPELSFKILSVEIKGRELDLVEEGDIIRANIPGRGTTWQDRAGEWASIIKAALGNSFCTTIQPSIEGQPAT